MGTAGQEGLVNIAPKGMDCFRVLSPKQMLWLNVTGSGNETAAHVLENQRMTVMFCSFDKQTLILRLYGNANVIHLRDESWQQLIYYFPNYTEARQCFIADLTRVQSSCGYSMPFYQFTGERSTLNKWADGKGREGIQQYWKEKNTISLDKKDTGIIDID